MGAYSKLHNATYLQLTKEFPELILRENIRPAWLVSSKLTKLEIDIFIEQLNTAIEIQGIQHYVYIPYFHKTYHDFEEQCRRDQEKKDLCFGHGVRLVEIACLDDLREYITELRRSKKAVVITPKSSKFRGWNVKKWWKRKMMIKAGLIIPGPSSPGKQPGSYRQRKYARKILHCELIEPGTWKVWGGQNDHITKMDGANISCDCQRFQVENKLCSHIIKIGFEIMD